MKVRVGDEEKGTAAAEGLEEPGWAEVLEFAVSGEMTSNPDEEIVVRVWDHHWVRHQFETVCHALPAAPSRKGPSLGKGSTCDALCHAVIGLQTIAG